MATRTHAPDHPLRRMAGNAVGLALRVLRRHRIPEIGDCTLALLLDPYRFVGRTCAELGSDVFASRFLLRPTLFLMGQEGAELFSNPAYFQRRGAVPLRLQRTLLGRGGVQTLDGERHHWRKAMFMSLVGPEQVQRLVSLTLRHLKSRAQGWPGFIDIDFYEEMRNVLTRAVCAWAGLPLSEAEVPLRTQQLTALFDQVALFGPPHWRSLYMRRQAERWTRDVVRQVRKGKFTTPENSALFTVAWQRDSDGGLLKLHTAAVELLNVLRPVVAVSVYAVFTAMALEAHPDWREKLARGNGRMLEAFVQEVRRFYPFFPQAVARTRCRFEWKGLRFRKGVRVMLDLHATNHDPRLWDAPDTFRPERFLEQAVGAYGFIPQGAGDHYVNHRCPGEGITVELLKVVAKFLARDVNFELDAEDREINWRRLPPLPRGEFMLRNVEVMQ